MSERTIPMYHVEYVLLVGDKWTAHVIPIRDLSEAANAARLREGHPKLYACVRMTGPHQHCVPA